MKKHFSLILLFLFSICFCFAQGTWTQKADFGGGVRLNAAGTGLNGKGYIGLGNDTVSNQVWRDWWEYDPVNDVWTQKTSLPAIARLSASILTLNNKIYIVGGGSCGFSIYSDCWEYDPVLNTWTAKANLAAGSREMAAAFSIGTKGYITTGQGGITLVDTQEDLWEYDATQNTWTQKANFGGGKRVLATGFSIGSKGYVAAGMDPYSSAQKLNDLWEYDPALNAWTRKSDVPGPKRQGAVSFSLNGKGFVGFGAIDSVPVYQGNDFWCYEPSTDSWSQLPVMNGLGRLSAVGFTIASKGYLGTGEFTPSSVYKDFWEFDATGVGLAENPNTFSCSFFPNPMQTSSTLEIPETFSSNSTLVFELFNLQGKLVRKSPIEGRKMEIYREDLATGVYTYRISTPENLLATGKLVICQ
jgi:N-acetylneuraminic acid mutarotase